MFEDCFNVGDEPRALVVGVSDREKSVFGRYQASFWYSTHFEWKFSGVNVDDSLPAGTVEDLYAKMFLE